jgi:hypothetical protein
MSVCSGITAFVVTRCTRRNYTTTSRYEPQRIGFTAIDSQADVACDKSDARRMKTTSNDQHDLACMRTHASALLASVHLRIQFNSCIAIQLVMISSVARCRHKAALPAPLRAAVCTWSRKHAAYAGLARIQRMKRVKLMDSRVCMNKLNKLATKRARSYAVSKTAQRSKKQTSARCNLDLDMPAR